MLIGANNRIVSATRAELAYIHKTQEWHEEYTLNEYVEKMKKAGVEIVSRRPKSCRVLNHAAQKKAE